MDDMNRAIRTIYDEHRSISAVLSGLKELALLARQPGMQPNFAVFRAMIHYIDEFPERLHHPKEDRFLFALLEERSPAARPLIEQLRAEHELGARLVRELESTLLAFEVNGARDASAFDAAVNAYAQFHWEHMRKEEKVLMPLAEQHLSADDWRRIAGAFAGNLDPLADLRERDFEQLYRRIANLAPEPVGLGARWQKSS
jgi:hemerythrin-like domain-containing protein